MDKVLEVLSTLWIPISFGLLFLYDLKYSRKKKNNSESKPTKLKTEEKKHTLSKIVIDPIRDESKPYASLQEEYVYAIFDSCGAIHSKYTSALMVELKFEIVKKIDYYTKKEFTKYGNHYQNIYNKYEKKQPKNFNEAVLFIKNFKSDYEKSLSNLVKRLQKEYDKEQKEIQQQEERNDKRAERREKFILLTNNVGEELAKHITKYPLTSEEVGLRYEQYIGYLYEEEGFDIVYYGATKGVKDGGRDLIASKKGITIIIQCKNRKATGEIHENTVNQLNTVYLKYGKLNPHIKNVRPALITTHDNLDDDAKESLKLFNISHKVIPMSDDYPMIKCNINKATGKKIYHLPTDGQYNRIKIRKKHGNFYCFSPSTAERYGFIRTKI